MSRAALLAALALVRLGLPVAALAPPHDLPPTVAADLADSGTAYWLESLREAELAPDDRRATRLAADVFALRPDISVEALMLLDMPIGADDVEHLSTLLFDPTVLDSIRFLWRDVNGMRPVFRYSEYVEFPDGRFPEREAVLEQTILPLDAAHFRYTVRPDGDGWVFTMSNVSPLRFSGMRVVAPGDMLLHVLIAPADDYGSLAYGVGALDLGIGGGLLRDRIATPFQDRFVGMLTWLDGTLRSAVE